MKSSVERVNKELGEDVFVRFSNTEAFPLLSITVRDSLKTYGVYNSNIAFPRSETEGLLYNRSDGFIQFAHRFDFAFYCIDPGNSERIIIVDDQGICKVNDSLEIFWNCVDLD